MDPHARAFSFSRERARLNPIPDDLVISDSDPESIDNMDNLTTTKAAASQSHGRSQRIESSRIRGRGSIIELSDDSSRQPSIAGIIELSDDSDSQDGMGDIKKNATSRQPPQTPQMLPAPPLLAAVATSRKQIVEIDDSDSESETPSIDLSRFAYATKPSQPRQQTPASSMKSIRATLPSKPSSSRTLHSATDFLTDREIERLSRCVACGIAWTTKKTIPKKRHHMRLCQKKNDLTDDTIHVLVEKELAQSAEDTRQKGKGKGKSKESNDPERALTLMNELVHDAQPKKRAKRKEVPPTIVGIEHQHETIQQRAKQLFELDSDDEERSTPGLSAKTSTTFPLTQEFPASKLAGGKRLQTDVSTSLPSPIPSDDEDKPISISSDSESSALGNFSSRSLQGNERRQRLPNALRQSLTLYDGEDQWMEDLQREIDTRESVAQWLDTDMPDAWGIATPVRGVEKKSTPSLSAVSKKNSDPRPRSTSPKKLSTPRTPVKQRPAKLPSSSTVPSSIGKTTLKRAGATSPIKGGNPLQDAHDQENFNHLMQERIKQNTALWHRVLRYEPVNFTEFLDIALASGVPSKKLTDKLRIFLISRAIHTSMPRKERRR